MQEACCLGKLVRFFSIRVCHVSFTSKPVRPAPVVRGWTILLFCDCSTNRMKEGGNTALIRTPVKQACTYSLAFTEVHHHPLCS